MVRLSRSSPETLVNEGLVGLYLALALASARRRPLSRPMTARLAESLGLLVLLVGTGSVRITPLVKGSALAALQPLHCVVVDDASLNPHLVSEVAHRPCADMVPLPVKSGAGRCAQRRPRHACQRRSTPDRSPERGRSDRPRWRVRR